jgi:peptidyl-tRNA hydrolase, PTH1 family
MVVDELARRWNAPPPRRAFSGMLWDARFGARRVLLLEPMTFMNRSGQAVAELVRFYKALPQDVLIVLDDLALPPGKVRLRAGGSAGGHNGLDDVLACLGTQEVARLRLGIGEPTGGIDAIDYVLGRMNEDELAAARQAVDQACQAVEDWLTEGLQAAMNRHN